MKMKKINIVIDSYTARQRELLLKNLKTTDLLKAQIKNSNYFLNKLRLHLRDYAFESNEDEIYFFKRIKPQLCGELIFYSIHLAYLCDKPDSTICREISFVKSELKKLESKKRKNKIFYRYYINNHYYLDDKYFVRHSGQFNLFASVDNLCLDPEFNTSHDKLAAEVITYHLLTKFYKKELERLQKTETTCPDTNNDKTISLTKLQWTASKTDLVELIYALKDVGAIENGNIDIKELSKSLEILFHIPLGDVYRTFNDVRSRKVNQTKFIDKLKLALETRFIILDKL